MKKRDYVISLVLNLLILGMEGFALSNTLIGYAGGIEKEILVNFFDHFTNLSNILLTLAALVMVIADLVALKKGKLAKGAVLLKYAATISVFVTFLIAWAVLLPTSNPIKFDFVIGWTGFLWLHTICPVLAALSFLAFEREPKLKWTWSFLGLSSVVLYCAVIIPLVLAKVIDDPYGFFDFNRGMNYFIVAAAIIGTFLLAYLFLVVHNIPFRKGIKEEAKAEEPTEVSAKASEEKAEEPEEKSEAKPEEPHQESAKEEAPEKPVEKQAEKETAKPQSKKATPKKEVKKDAAPKVEAKPAPNDADARIYHVAKRDKDGKWQVKLAKGDVAIKLFDTQAEAIDYANGLVKTQGGSIRVHSLKGKMRKK